MIEQIQYGEDPEQVEFYMQIFSLVIYIYYPIYLKELVAITDLPEELFGILQLLNELVDLCSSFLTV